MKKSFLIGIALFLTIGFTYGQKLKEGTLVGTHLLTIELNPGVTMDQLINFYKETVGPEYEKHFPGWKFYFTKGLRGENINRYGWIIVIDSAR